MKGTVLKKSASIFAFAAVLLTAFFLRTIDLHKTPPGYHFDEARVAVRAWRVAEGYGMNLYLEDIPEPFDSFVRGAFIRFTGSYPFTTRLFTVYLNMLAVAATIAAARSLRWKQPFRDGSALVAGLTLAVLPASVIIGRAVYRANWTPVMSMLALTYLGWAWRTGKTPHYALAGLFTALASMFYLGGLAFAPTMAILILLAAAIKRRTWPGVANLAVMAGVGAVTMIPWLYLFFRVPGWLTTRIDDLTDIGVSPTSDPVEFIRHMWQAVEPIYRANTSFTPHYNTLTDPFLNPALLVLLLVGLITVLRYWREPPIFAPLVIGVGLIIPAMLTASPAEPIRLVAIFAPLSLLVGWGASTLLEAAERWPHMARRLAWAALALALVISPLRTYDHFRYHFYEQPEWITHDIGKPSLDYYYFSRLADTAQYVIKADQPVYFPVNYLNYPNLTALLRPPHYRAARAYAGEPLPAGELFLPVSGPEDGTYGSPYVDRPTQYALLLPDEGEIVLLPPLPAPDDTAALEDTARRSGTPIQNDQGWLLGHSLPVSADDNPFAAVAYRAFDQGEKPLAVFDKRLELLDVVLPASVTPGEAVPITFYWRLLSAAREDYGVGLGLMEPISINKRGNQQDIFAIIFRYCYPTSMWQAGEVVAEVRWLYVYPDAPPGGYNLGIEVLTYPGPEATSFEHAAGTGSFDGMVLAGRTLVPLPPFAQPSEDAFPVDAVFGDSIKLVSAQLDPPPGTLAPGDTLFVRLFWEAVAPPPGDYVVFVHLDTKDQPVIAQQDERPLGGVYPTQTWRTGAQITTEYTLAVPDDSSGPYFVTVGIYSWPDIVRLPVVQEGAELPDAVVFR